MRILSNLGMRQQLALAFGMIVALVVILAFTAWSRISAVQHDFEALVDRTLPALTALSEVNDKLQVVRSYELKHLAALTMPAKDREEQALSAAVKDFDSALANYLKLSASANAQSLQADLSKAVSEFHAARFTLLQMSNSAAGAEAERAVDASDYFNGPGQQLFKNAYLAGQQLWKHHVDQAENAKALGRAALTRANQWLAVVAGASVLLSVILAIFIPRRLMYQLGGEPAYAKSIAGRIADGDLTMVIELAPNDTQSLLYSLHEMQARLAERTEQLRQKTNDINAMLQNMPQGVLTVVKGGVIHPEYSAYMTTIFETDDIADRPVMELVFNGSNLGADILSQIETTIDSVIGEDEMQYDFNSHLLVTEFDLTMPDGRVKSIGLSWSPISDHSGIVDKLMVCVRDETELKALAAAAGQQKRELDIIGQILAISQEKFSGFIDGSVEFLAENKKIIEGVGASPQGRLDPNTATELFRNMHTVKGNARTYGLLHLTNLVHEAEQSYEELRKNPDAIWDQEKLLEELAKASAAIEEYAHINKVKLGRTGPGRRAGVEKYLMVQKQDIQDALELMDDSARGNNLEVMRSAHQRVHKMLEMLGTVRVHEALEGIVESLPSLAKELHKAPPKVSINDNNVVLRTQIADLLKNVFMHLYRNSLDHGIEAPEKRLAMGKPAAGHINLDVSLADGRVLLKLGDDGAGLAVALIRQRAIEKGILAADQQSSSEDVAQLIFAPGFSTAAVVTEVSGRGVGMDAVKSFVEREGGSIKLVFRNPDSGSNYRAFDTVISMPSNFAVKAVD